MQVLKIAVSSLIDCHLHPLITLGLVNVLIDKEAKLESGTFAGYLIRHLIQVAGGTGVRLSAGRLIQDYDLV